MSSQRKTFGQRKAFGPPRSAETFLDRTFQTFGLSRKVKEYAAFPHWEEIVGQDIAKVSKPEKILARKILVVRVIDASWGQELALRKGELLQRIEEFGVGPRFEDIRFITGNPQEL